MFAHETRSTKAGASFPGRTLSVIVAAITACSAGAAHAQWTVHYLHPSGAEYAGHHSQLYHTQGGQHVGGILSPDFLTERAGLWSGTAGSWIDLSPPDAIIASAQGVHNGQQVGYVYDGDTWYASLWSGTADSIVNLMPAGAVGSTAFSIHGGQVGGSVWYSDSEPSRAGIWHRTAESFVDLHPATATGPSWISQVRDGYQVGIVDIDGITRASLWNGTAESYVDMHPSAAGVFSQLTDVQGGQQVGLIFDLFFNVRAGLWNGTADSFVDLTPAGALHSAAIGIYGGLQVGWAEFLTDSGFFITKAGFWSGTADSWVDLHQFLDGSWSFSTVSNIWMDGDTIYISGSGDNDITGRHEALLWTYTIPAPGTGALFALGLSAIVRRRRSA